VAYIISDECINCGACESECPNQAISQGSVHFDIDPNRCTECVGFFDQAQCVLVCPNESIALDPAHVETKEALMAKKVKLHGS
jgi:ferredoxin